jgi:outer membrane immunogenic protein
MLRQSGGVRIVVPRQGGRRVGPFKSLAAVSLLALVGATAVAPAQAADLGGNVSSNQNEEEFGFRGPTVFDWSGIYVGGHLGGAWGDVEWSGPDVATYVDGDRVNHEMDGWLAGGHLGFNHQFGRWVGGAEVSLSGSDVEGSSVNEIGPFDVVTGTEIDSLFLATVRFGYAWDRSLAYVKGGYASADVKLRGAGEFGEAEVGFSSSERHAGFTIGGGFEYALTSRVILGVEYNRVDLGSATHVGFATVDDELVDRVVPVRVEPEVLHLAMARLSLKFGDEAAELPAVLK